jgi:hypothetical protein
LLGPSHLALPCLRMRRRRGTSARRRPTSYYVGMPHAAAWLRRFDARCHAQARIGAFARHQPEKLGLQFGHILPTICPQLQIAWVISRDEFPQLGRLFVLFSLAVRTVQS